MSTVVTYFTNTNKNNSCGLNPFCHIRKTILFILVLLIVGIILHALFFKEIFKKSWPSVEWGNLTKKDNIYNNKCCVDYGCTGKLKDNSYNLENNTCCVTERINSNTKKETCEQVNCKKWLDPCVDCNISKEFTVNNQIGTYDKTIKRKKCNNIGDSDLQIPNTLYANPDNLAETTQLSKGTKVIGLSIGLVIWYIILFIRIIFWYIAYKASKALYNKITS